MLIFGCIFTVLIVLLGVGYISTSRSLDRILKQIDNLLESKSTVYVKDYFETIYKDVSTVNLTPNDAKCLNYFLINTVFKSNPLRCVCINLDGLAGYSSIFIQVAFKDIINRYPNVTFECNDEPLLVEEIATHRVHTWKY